MKKQKVYIVKIIIILCIVIGTSLAVSLDYYVSTLRSAANWGYKNYNIELEKDELLSQELYFKSDYVRSMGLCILNSIKQTDAFLDIKLLTDEGEEVWHNEMPVSNFISHQVTWFEVKQQVNTGKLYVIQIRLKNSLEKVVLAGVEYGGAIEECRTLTLDEKDLDCSLGLNVNYPQYMSKVEKIKCIIYAILLMALVLFIERLWKYKFALIGTIISIVITDIFFSSVLTYKYTLNYKLFLFISVISFGSFVIQLFFFNIKQIKKPEVLFVILMLTWGLIYSVAMPPFMSPDENRHYAESYKLSNIIMGTTLTDKDGRPVVREEDNVELKQYLDEEYIVGFWKQIDKANVESEEYTILDVTTGLSVPVYQYFPQAFGIVVARLLHLNHVWLLYFGRIFSLLFYTIVVYYAIKIIPCGKLFLVSMSQIPILIELVSSYSYDTVIIATSIFLIAYSLYLSFDKEKLSNKDIVFLLLLCGIIGTLKYAYIPIIAVCFMIPAEKIGSKKKALFVKSMFIVAVLLFVYVFMTKRVLNMSSFRSDSENAFVMTEDIVDESIPEEINNFGEFTSYNLKYISNNIIEIRDSITRTLVKSGDNYIVGLLGGELGWLEIRLPFYIILGNMVMLGITLIYQYQDSTIQFTEKYRRIVILAMIISIGGIFAAAIMLWSIPVEQKVTGVQGRYFLPLLPLLIIVAHKYKRNKNTIIEKYVVCNHIIQQFIIWYVCYELWKR